MLELTGNSGLRGRISPRLHRRSALTAGLGSSVTPSDGVVAAVSQGTIPGVVKASAAGTDMAAGAIALGLILLTLGLQNHGAGSARPTISPTTPSSVPAEKPNDGKVGSTPVGSPTTPGATPPDNLAKPGDATLAEDRRKYILDGNERGGGGHGPGRTTPDNSTFPSDWSDEKTIEAIKDVANPSYSARLVVDHVLNAGRSFSKRLFHRRSEHIWWASGLTGAGEFGALGPVDHGPAG